jgi:Zn-dependent protease
MNLEAIGYGLSVWLLPVLTAITLHEAAHAWTADKLGDDTARRLGRVTFNPIKHIDPFGTILLPAILLLIQAPVLFGYAKPVPVAFHRLRNPKRDMIFVAIAGPVVNVLLALLAGVLLHSIAFLPQAVASWAQTNLVNAIVINLVLAIFNMLPIPPLDGGRVLTGLLPYDLAWRFARLERVGMVILLLLLFVVPLVARELGYAFNPIFMFILPPLQWGFEMVLRVTGVA